MQILYYSTQVELFFRPSIFREDFRSVQTHSRHWSLDPYLAFALTDIAKPCSMCSCSGADVWRTLHDLLFPTLTLHPPQMVILGGIGGITFAFSFNDEKCFVSWRHGEIYLEHEIEWDTTYPLQRKLWGKRSPPLSLCMIWQALC